MHACPECGTEHEAAAPEVVPVPVPVDPGPNDNDVRIAEIEAAASIEREKLWNEQEKVELLAEVERQRGEISGMKEILDRLVPPVPEEPEPTVIEVPPAAPVEEEGSVPDAPKPPTTKAAAKRGFF